MKDGTLYVIKTRCTLGQNVLAGMDSVTLNWDKSDKILYWIWDTAKTHFGGVKSRDVKPNVFFFVWVSLAVSAPIHKIPVCNRFYNRSRLFFTFCTYVFSIILNNKVSFRGTTLLSVAICQLFWKYRFFLVIRFRFWLLCFTSLVKNTLCDLMAM